MSFLKKDDLKKNEHKYHRQGKAPLSSQVGLLVLCKCPPSLTTTIIYSDMGRRSTPSPKVRVLMEIISILDVKNALAAILMLFPIWT